MAIVRRGSLVLGLAFSAAVHAAQFDGSAPLECTAHQGYDCLPAVKRCSPLQPETKVAPVFAIDFAGKVVHSPYRKALLHASQTTTNEESLVLQGADLLFAWSALVNKMTGAFTVSIADRNGAYVVFGQCKLPQSK